MKKFLFAAGLMFLLFFGCVQEQPPVEQPAEPEMTCNEYCKGQPHVACEGTWDISGDYPVCVCNFVCDQSDEPAEIANPAAVNCEEKGYSYDMRDSTGYCSFNGGECEEWALYRMECCLKDSDCADMECQLGVASCDGNACVCQEPADISPPVATDKTLRALLDDGVGAINDEFYSQIESGTYNITSYKWLHTAEDDPDIVVVGDAGITADVLFNGKEMTGIVAFGAKVFEQTDGPEEQARGLAIFTDSPKLLSDLYESESNSLRILYKGPTPDILLEECTVTGFERYRQLDHNDRVLEYYTFTCEKFSEQEE